MISRVTMPLTGEHHPFWQATNHMHRAMLAARRKQSTCTRAPIRRVEGRSPLQRSEPNDRHMDRTAEAEEIGAQRCWNLEMGELARFRLQIRGPAVIAALKPPSLTVVTTPTSFRLSEP